MYARAHCGAMFIIHNKGYFQANFSNKNNKKLFC